MIKLSSFVLQPSPFSLYDLIITIFYESHAFAAIDQLSFFFPIQPFASFLHPIASTLYLKLYYNYYHYVFDYLSNFENTDEWGFDSTIPEANSLKSITTPIGTKIIENSSSAVQV